MKKEKRMKKNEKKRNEKNVDHSRQFITNVRPCAVKFLTMRFI